MPVNYTSFELKGLHRATDLSFMKDKCHLCASPLNSGYWRYRIDRPGMFEPEHLMMICRTVFITGAMNSNWMKTIQPTFLLRCTFRKNFQLIPNILIRIQDAF